MFSKIYSQIKAPFIPIQEAKPREVKVGADCRYTGTDQKEAQEELSKILGFIGSDTEALDVGALRLAHNWDGSFELKKRTISPYHWYSFLGWGRDIGAADNYVRGVMKAALGSDSNVDENHPLANYLNNRGKLTTKEVIGCLSSIVTRDIEVEEKISGEQKSFLAKVGGTLSLPKTGNKVLAMEVKSQLPLLGIKLGEEIGRGAFGTVCHASLKGQQEKKYVVKIEKIDDSSFENIKEDGDKLPFDKRGELTAWAATNIPRAQIMKPSFLIIAIKKTPFADIEYHYLSPSEAKAFTKKIGDQYPGATAAIAAELMEYLPGKNLEKTLESNTFSPSSWAFKNTLNGLLKEFIVAYKNGIIHRDRKPANIIVTGKLDEKDDHCIKSIDYGLAAVVPTSGYFSIAAGTRYYASPRIVLCKNYRPEADAHSVAIILLQLVDRTSFRWFCSFFDQKNPSLRNFLDKVQEIDAAPESYFDAYFNQINSLFAGVGGPLPGEKTLNQPENVFTKDLIGRLFQVAAGGPNVEKNFEALCQQFEEFQKVNGYQSEAMKPEAMNLPMEEEVDTKNLSSRSNESLASTLARSSAKEGSPFLSSGEGSFEEVPL